jgi:ABC-type Na+ efflux pump permease subunit
MIRKEFSEITRSSLLKIFYTFIILTCLRFFSWGTNYFMLLTRFLGLLIYWIAIDYGNKMYKYEVNDRSWEYLLSIPMSRRRILFVKLFPRLINISVLLIIYTVAFYLFFKDVTINATNIIHPYILIPASLGLILGRAIFKMDEVKDKFLLIILDYASLGSLVWVFDLYMRPTFLKIYDEYQLLGNIMVGLIILTFFNFILFFRYFKFFDLKENNINGRLFVRFATPYLLSFTFFCLLLVFFRINNIL